MTLPTVLTRNSMGSSTSVMLHTGEVSVMPQAIVISGQCISVITRFITSTGHGAPAMMPVRRDDKSNARNCGWSSSAMNMVGTPCNAVQRSCATLCKVCTGLKCGAGRTIVAPCVTQARLPSTMPKQ